MKQFYKLGVLTCLSIGLLFYANFTFGQNIDIKWGEEFSEKNMVSLCSIVGEDANSYYTVKTKYGGMSGNNEAIFESYSMDHKLIKSQKLNLKTAEGKDGSFMEMYQVQDKFIIFFRFFDSKTKSNTLYASNMDMSGKQSPAILIDTEPATLYTVYQTFSFVLSNDATKVLVISDTDHKQETLKKYKYIMLKSNIEVLWQKDINSSELHLDLISSVIDETGNVFMLGSSLLDTKGAEPIFNVIAYDYGHDKFEDVGLKLDESIYVKELKFVYNKKGLYVIGFYYDKNANNITGLIYSRINTNNFSLENQKVEPFGKDAQAKFMSEKKAAKGESIENSYRIRDVIITEDGSIQLIAENYYTRILSQIIGSDGMSKSSALVVKTSEAVKPAKLYPGYGEYVKTTEENSNLDIVVIQLTKDGKQEWLARVPKNQYSENDVARYSSYLFIRGNGNLYILYNDNPKNAVPPKKATDKESIAIAQLSNIEKATIMVATIDGNGNVKRERYVSPNSKENIAIKTIASKRMEGNKIWTIGFKGNKRMYGFITVQ